MPQIAPQSIWNSRVSGALKHVHLSITSPPPPMFTMDWRSWK